MFGRTHVILGIFTSATVMVLVPSASNNIYTLAASSAIAAAASVATSQLADIDSVHSMISRKIPSLSFMKSRRFAAYSIVLSLLLVIKTVLVYNQSFTINKYLVLFAVLSFLNSVMVILFKEVFGHRKITHSLLFTCILCAIVIVPFFYGINTRLYMPVSVGLLSGIISHIIYDCMTVRGCPLLAPFSNKNYKFLRLKSGKQDYIGILISFFLLCLAYWTKFMSDDIIKTYQILKEIAIAISQGFVSNTKEMFERVF